VRKNDTILSEFSEYRGNFNEYALGLFNRIETNSMKTFELTDMMFHYINADGLTALCMTDKKFYRK
jgi:hypothetical protein